jgi:tRNA-2-methylthio-N6-dimethylallyladenosine synthase
MSTNVWKRGSNSMGRQCIPPPKAVRFRYVVHTFGCQMNVHDSERIEGVLSAAGGAAVATDAEADLIVFNTCSVREKAEQKLRSEVGKLAPLKRARPDVVVAVAGCVAQQEGEALLPRMPSVDLVVGPDKLAELPALLLEQMSGAPPAVHTGFDLEAPRFLTALPSPSSGRRASVVGLVTTMKGCDERCSFCIVPYTRGPERYRPAREVVDEVARFVEAGSREILLLGQTVDSFRDPALPPPDADDREGLAGGDGVGEVRARAKVAPGDETQFGHLLRLIASSVPAYDMARPDAPGLARLRYVSPHPRHATASLAKAHAELDVLARHVHLPVQSGSDRVLRRMIRRYTRAEYVARAERLMRARPGLTLSTDVIVGFPGETDDDFEETLSLVREVGFVSLFGFKYSQRPYTPALRLADDVSEEKKSERLARLFELSDALCAAHLSRLVGTQQKVLIEGASKSEKGDLSRGRVQGRTERNEIVHVEAPGAESLVGAVVPVEIVRANRHSLVGAPLVPVPAPRTERSAATGPRRLPLH